MTQPVKVTKPPTRRWLDDDDHASALTAEFRLWASLGMGEARIILDSPCLAITRPLSPPARKPRKPTLASALTQAAKAGKSVKGAEVYQDRIALQFGTPESAEPDNSWPLDEFRTKETKQ